MVAMRRSIQAVWQALFPAPRSRLRLGSGDRGTIGCGGRLRNAPLVGFPLKIAKMFLESGAKITRRALKLRHHFSEISRQLRQLLGAEDNQGHDEDNDHVRDAEHFSLAAEPSGAVFAS